jgi:YjbE family integral membrane protein
LIHAHFVTPAFAAFLQVILIDIVLAGDNAVVIGMAAAKVPRADRRRVIFWGLVAAVVLRIVLASATITVLHIGWLMFAGGSLLLWVSWRLYRDIARPHDGRAAKGTLNQTLLGANAPRLSPTNVRQAIIQVAVADLSMSLDNVLAVAGAAINHPGVLAVGLVLSVGLVGFAASAIANLLQRHPWISYAALILVVYVALRMMYLGGYEMLYAPPH